MQGACSLVPLCAHNIFCCVREDQEEKIAAAQKRAMKIQEEKKAKISSREEKIAAAQKRAMKMQEATKAKIAAREEKIAAAQKLGMKMQEEKKAKISAWKEMNAAAMKAHEEKKAAAAQEKIAAQEEKKAAAQKAQEEKKTAAQKKPENHEICRGLFQVSSQHLAVASPMLLTHPMSAAFKDGKRALPSAVEIPVPAAKFSLFPGPGRPGFIFLGWICASRASYSYVWVLVHLRILSAIH